MNVAKNKLDNLLYKYLERDGLYKEAANKILLKIRDLINNNISLLNKRGFAGYGSIYYRYDTLLFLCVRDGLYRLFKMLCDHFEDQLDFNQTTTFEQNIFHILFNCCNCREQHKILKILLTTKYFKDHSNLLNSLTYIGHKWFDLKIPVLADFFECDWSRLRNVHFINICLQVAKTLLNLPCPYHQAFAYEHILNIKYLIRVKYPYDLEKLKNYQCVKRASPAFIYLKKYDLLQEIWILESERRNNYVQWLPEELIDFLVDVWNEIE